MDIEHIHIPDHEFDISFSRSSGAGGQNVNKVNSRATLRWRVDLSPSLTPGIRNRFLKKYGTKINSEGELVIHSDRYRDQPKNIQDCKDKLADMIKLVLYPPKKRISTRPNTAARERRIAGKKANAEKKKLRGKKNFDY